MKTKYGLQVRKVAGRTERAWVAHPAQARIMADPARFKVIPCGRRFGKTELAAMVALQWARQTTPRKPVWWVAPTYDACEPGLDAIEELWPPEWIMPNGVRRTKGGMRVLTRWGAQVSFRSAEKERTLRGRGLGGLIIEESGEVPDHAMQVLRPALYDTTAGAVLIGTPKGRNWFYRVAAYHEDPERHPGWRTFHYTTYANPLLDRAEILASREDMTDRLYRQEVLAEFIADTGGVFHEPRACAQGAAWQRGALPGLTADGEDPAEGETYVLGWDVARDQDWSVITIDHAATRRTVYWDRFKKVPYPQQVQRVIQAARHYRATVIFDSTGPGDGVMDFLLAAAREAGVEAVPFKFTHASKQNVVDNHAILVAQRATTWPDIPRLTNEHEVFEWKAGGGSGAPSGEHDDCVISKALATYLASRLSAASPGARIDLGRIGRGPAPRA